MEKSKLRFPAFYFLGFIMALTSCGGGGSGGGTPSDTPSISTLTYSPSSATLNSGGGTATVNGTFAFSDEGGNLSTLTISTFNSAGDRLSTQTVPITGLGGVKSGTINGTVIVPTTMLGRFSFQVYLTDALGSQSNTLTGNFSVKDIMWVTKTPMPTPRSFLAASTVNGKIYAIGGREVLGGGGTNKVEEYDPATDTWTTKAAMPTARYGLAASVVNGKIYAIGGIDAFGDSNKVEEYDPTTNTWATKTPMPTSRFYLAVSAVNGKIYAIGGTVSGPGITTPVNKMEEYDPNTNTWTAKANMPTARSSLSAAVLNAKILAIAGDGGIRNEVEEYDPATNTWAIKTPIPTQRYGLAAGVVTGKIYAIGGFVTGIPPNNYSSKVEEYDPATITWATKSPMPTPRYFLAASAANGKIYAIGGEEAVQNVIGRVEEYDPARDNI